METTSTSRGGKPPAPGTPSIHFVVDHFYSVDQWISDLQPHIHFGRIYRRNHSFGTIFSSTRWTRGTTIPS